MFFKSATLSLLLTFVVYTWGLKLTLDKLKEGPYCGKLQCLADDSTLPNTVLSTIGMTIYDITHQNLQLKLASVSAFTPGVFVEPTKISDINATGGISKNQANLVLGLLSSTDCLYASFQCELDFVNTNGQSDVIREFLTPADDNVTIINILAQMAEQLNTQTEALSRALQELSRIEKLLSTSCIGNGGHVTDSPNTAAETVSCYRGMPNANPREKFNLWNKTVTLCDTESDGGGWIIIQRRVKGDVNFFRSWIDYKKGFGTADTDFWIGNDLIHNLTSQGYNELRVDYENDGVAYYGQWSYFYVANEQLNYRLNISGISGTLYNNMLDNQGMYFSTYDSDNDSAYYNNCAQDARAGWWFSGCGRSNLNGVWGATGGTAIKWGDDNQLSNLEMKVRLVKI